MSEDSKKLSNSGSFGLKAHFHAHPAMPIDEFVTIMEGLLKEVGDRVVEEHGSLLGHIKAFVTTPQGTLKVNLIDTDLGPETLNRLTAPVHEGEIKFMAALMNVSDHDIEEIMEESLEDLEDLMDLEVEEHHHEHEHHDHHEHEE